MRSIRQNPRPQPRPDYRNLGVILRAILLANLLALLAALVRNSQLPALPAELVEMAGRVEPPLLAAVGLAWLLQPWLARGSRGRSDAVIILLGAALAAGYVAALGPLLGVEEVWRGIFWGALGGLAVAGYFRLQGLAYSPALAEARMMALTARIRPHFLFNSLNAVLGVIRSDPKRAEAALEELSELFRVLMGDNRELVTLEDELALCRQYLELEDLRLGERLRVNVANMNCPLDARVPPLMLQPLLENAVYHGIEPADEPGEIQLRLTREGGEILIDMTNPLPPQHRHHPGNRMALENIRERLMLFYDLEARLDTWSEDGHFNVRIRLPYRPGGTSRRAAA